MDIFNEQIIKKKKTATDLLLIIAIYFAGFFLGGALLFFVLRFMPTFLITAALFACIIFYFAIKLGNYVNVEFEYSVTNNILDVDKIIARSSRKRLVSIDIKTVDDIGSYNAEKFKGKQFDLTVNSAGDINSDDLCFVVTRHPTKGKVLVVFEPDEKIKNAIKKSLPYNLKNNI